MSDQTRDLVSVAVGAVAVSGAFVVTTVLMDQISDASLVALPLAVAAVVAVALGWPELMRARCASRGDLLNAALGGIGLLWAAPLVVLAQRASDAPSGSESLFLTTSLWGVLVTTGAWALARRKSLVGPAAALLAAAGALAILSNWEKPSSFSPFTRFLGEEVVMMAAGLLALGGMVALRRASQGLDRRALLGVAVLAALAAGAVAALPTVAADLASVPRFSTALLFLGGCVAAGAWGIVRLCTSPVGFERAAVPYLLAPVVVTLLAFVERVVGVYGPNPIDWSQVLPGALVVATAAATVWVAQRHRSLSQPSAGQRWTLTVVLAGISTALGAGALVSPALTALSEGNFSTPFRAQWVMYGYETASGWMLFAAGLLSFAAAVAVRTEPSRIEGVIAAVAAAAGALSAWLTRVTTIHPWNSFIPNDVQQTYGTEYARFSVEALFSPVMVAAGAATLFAAVALGVVAMTSSGARPSTSEDT